MQRLLVDRGEPLGLRILRRLEGGQSLEMLTKKDNEKKATRWPRTAAKDSASGTA